MDKNISDKQNIENTIDNIDKKDNDQMKKKNSGSLKYFLVTLLVLVLVGLGFYYHIIQEIFYSFLSIIFIVLVLALGLGWEYWVYTHFTTDEFTFINKEQNNTSDSWKNLEEEFKLWIASSEQKIKQVRQLSLLNYMTAIGLFIISAFVLLVNWIYDVNPSPSAYQQFNPAFALTIILLLFSILFMLLHYINQKDSIKKQEKLDHTIQWILSLKTAHTIGKEHMLEIINSNNLKS